MQQPKSVNVIGFPATSLTVPLARPSQSLQKLARSFGSRMSLRSVTHSYI